MMDSVPHIPEGLERVGDKASDILLPTKDGERYTLADAKRDFYLTDIGKHFRELSGSQYTEHTPHIIC